MGIWGTNALQGVLKEPEVKIGILGGLMGAKIIHGDFIGQYSGGSKEFSEVLKCSKWAYEYLWSPMGLLENTKGTLMVLGSLYRPQRVQEWGKGDQLGYEVV